MSDDYAAELKHYIRHLQRELQTVQKGQAPAPAPDPISNHAIVRYLEWVKGVDMRRLRAEILRHERCGLRASCPGKIKGNGCELICSKGVVMTVVA